MKLNRYPKVLAFAGGMAAGKDTYGNLYKEELESMNIPILHYSFATPLKDEVDLIIDGIKKSLDPKEIANQVNSSEDSVKQAIEIIKEDVLKDFSITSKSRTPNIRKALQFWGTDVRRKENPNYWVDKVKEVIIKENKNGKHIIITDARFVNEFNIIKELGGKVVFLECSLEERLRRIRERDGIEVSIEALSHPSEIGCLEYDNYDLTIDTECDTIENNFKTIKKELI